MAYVDGFLLPLKKKNIKAYKKLSTLAGKVWKEHGALDYKECVMDGAPLKGFASFLKAAKAKSGETAVFAFITYKSKKHRNAVNAKVMKDPRVAAMCDPKKMPFNPSLMAYSGFKVIVDPK